MPFILQNAAKEICNMVGLMLDQKLFVSALPLTESFVRDGLLYWNLHNKQGYVVFNPITGTAHKISTADEAQSDKNLCSDSFAIVASLSISQFIDDYNSGETDYTNNIVRTLPESHTKLCETVNGILEIDGFAADIEEQTKSFVRDGKLYWDLHLNQGFVVIDPKNGTVHKVSTPEEELSNVNICDAALAILMDYDIFNYLTQYAQSMFLDVIEAMLLESILGSQFSGRKEGRTIH